jgi:hypothetical protein
MMTYKISKGSWSTYLNFETLQLAQEWTQLNLGSGYSVVISDFQINPPSPEEKLKSDKEFGSLLIEMFLLDNRLIQPPVSSQESMELLQKFEIIEKLANFGDIKTVKTLLLNIDVDDRVFTQDRKDKYLDLINNYK